MRLRTGTVTAIAAAALAGAAIAGTVGAGPAATTAAATSPDPSPTSEAVQGNGVTVTATGATTVVPDELHVLLAVEVTRPRADAALTASSRVAAKVADALKAAGVAERDLQTSGLEVAPEYDEAGDSVTGWTARTSLDVTIHDLSGAGRVLDAAITAGGPSIRVDSVSYDVHDKEAALAKARTQAFDRAETHARAYAQAAGRSLGSVVQIVETEDSPDTILPTTSVDSAAGSRSFDETALQAGSTQVTVTTTVRWSFT